MIGFKLNLYCIYHNIFWIFNSQVTKDELAKLVAGFDNPDNLTSNGVTLAGSRYIYLSGSDRIIRAKLGRNGVHCMKTTQGTTLVKCLDAITKQTYSPSFPFFVTHYAAVIVSIYEDPVQPQQAASIVEKLGDYLITCGY